MRCGREIRLTLALAGVVLAVAACGKTKAKSDNDQKSRDGLSLTLPDDGPKSPQRELLDAAVARAAAANKPVLIRLTGVWCPPCAVYDRWVEKNIDALRPTFAKYELLTLDEIYWDLAIGLDFVPNDVTWFPTYLVYEPNKGTWGVITIDNAPLFPVERFADLLNGIADTRDILSIQKQRYEDAFALDRLDADASKASDIYDYLESLSYSAPKDEALAAVAETKTRLDAKAESFGQLNYRFDVLARVLGVLTARGVMTPDEARAQIDAEAGPNPSIDDTELAGAYDVAVFFAGVQGVMRTKGMVEAAKECPELIKTSSFGSKEAIERRNVYSKIMCETLAMKAGSGDAQYARKLIADYMRDPNSNTRFGWSVIRRMDLAIGDWEAAAAAVEGQRDWVVGKTNDRAAEKDKTLAEDAAAIKKAKSDGTSARDLELLEVRQRSDIANFETWPLMSKKVETTLNEFAAALRAHNARSVFDHDVAGVESH